MRKICLTLFSLAFIGAFSASTSMAQTYRMVSPAILPSTSVVASITIERETIKKGPYAKFAQQYLGITVPLNDKVIYSVKGAQLGSVVNNNVDIQSVATSVNSKINLPIFSDMGISPIVYKAASSLGADKTTTREKSLEEMASDAVTAIFNLRKRRFDIITGEAGEGVFGAGLGSAIEEMKRLEDEYLSLFVGKSTKEIYTVEFFTTPERNKTSYVLCRFSESGGIVENSDVSGEPVVLNVNPGGVSQPIVERSSVKGAEYYRVPEVASCKLFCGSQLLVQKQLPVLQLGTTVEVAPK